jgi:hypothetical protein
VAACAFPFAKENERSLFFSGCHGSRFASGEVVDGGIGKDEGELKLGDRASEHQRGDRTAAGHCREESRKERPIRGGRVEPCYHSLTDRVIAEAAAVGRGNHGSAAIVELDEIGAEGAGRAGKPSCFG